MVLAPFFRAAMTAATAGGGFTAPVNPLGMGALEIPPGGATGRTTLGCDGADDSVELAVVALPFVVSAPDSPRLCALAQAT